MSFDDALAAVRAYLESEKRVAYRMLKRRFELDDEDIEDIKADLIDAKQLARDEDGRVLVWVETEAGRSGSNDGTEPESAPDAADRRLITVMFCDIVGSTELAARFDAEELRDIVRQYQSICASVINAHEGHIAQYLGDGLLVYFGYPRALEDEAGQATRAALGILEAPDNDTDLTERAGQPLQVRIGIHTGPVVIGEMGGAGRAEHLALGETPNIAARVQSAARPNEILITTDTFLLVQGLYDCEHLGPQELKGVGRPIDLYTVFGEGMALNRFEVALSTGVLTQYVGRDEELKFLGRNWDGAQSGRGQVVLLSGEAGIGKSRLAQEFKKETGDDARHVTLRCSPNHQKSAYYPVMQLLRRLFAFERDDTDAARIAKIDESLQRYTFAKPETAPLFASLLGIDHPQARHLDPADSPERKRMTMEALTAWLIEEATARPVFMIWDDVHWIDPSTHEFLAFYMDRIPGSHTLALLAFRSDYAPPWAPRTYLGHLTLGRLSDAEIESIVKNVAGRESVPERVVQLITDKTDGVPLYIEELTKAVVEAGLLESAAHEHPAGSLGDLEIPATLRDSLEARIDRCLIGKDIAQWGAVIGREFGHALLEHLIPGEGRLRRGLDELLGAELIYRSGTPDEPTYIFKHALIRDTAYESLLNKERRARHAEIAEVLETHFINLAEREPELLAHHFIEAGVGELAVEKLYEAGTRAVERSADAIAIVHLQQALELIVHLPDTHERTQKEREIQNLLHGGKGSA